MSLAVSQLQTVAHYACRAQRNTQQLYRFVIRARDICDNLNETLRRMAAEEGGENDANEAEELLDRLELLERYANALRRWEVD